MKKIILALATICLFASCADDAKTDDKVVLSEGEAAFVAQTEQGVYIDQKAALNYDKKEHQISFNGAKSEYLLANADFTEFYALIVKKGDALTLGGEITVNCNSVGVKSLRKGNIPMKVAKVEGNKSWLWSESMDTGFVLCFE